MLKFNKEMISAMKLFIRYQSLRRAYYAGLIAIFILPPLIRAIEDLLLYKWK